MYRHVMGQICPSGRKTDYAYFKDGAPGAQTSYFARIPSECFLREGVPVSNPQSKYYQIEFRFQLFCPQKYEKLWNIIVGFPNPWFIVTLNVSPV